MNDDTNVATVSIERRAKKHVRSRTHTWLAVCAPGLEQILCAEMTGCGIVPSATEIHGGVEFDGRLETGMTANLLLRTPSRVLVRVASFKGRAVEDIFRETAAIPWEAWIPCDCAVDLQPTIHSSRIESPTLLKTTVQDAMIRRFNNEALAPPRFIDVAGAQKVLARLDEDQAVAEVSIDLVRFGDDTTVPTYELEVELLPGGQVVDLEPVIAELIERWAVLPQATSKFERGLALCCPELISALAENRTQTRRSE